MSAWPCRVVVLLALAACAGPPGGAPPGSAAMSDAAALAASLAHLEARAAELNIRDAQQEFRLRRVVRDARGETHVRLDQVYHGVPVWGRQLVVHLGADGEARSVTGAYLPGIAAPTRAALSPEEARRRAAERFPGPLGGPPETELVLYPHDGRVDLVFRVVLTDDATPRRIVAFVDARTGELVDSYDDLRTPTPPASGPRE